MGNLNLMLGAKFELLGTNLSASYKKEGENYEILVAPNTLEKNNGISIEEMIAQVNRQQWEIVFTATVLLFYGT